MAMKSYKENDFIPRGEVAKNLPTGNKVRDPRRETNFSKKRQQTKSRAKK